VSHEVAGRGQVVSAVLTQHIDEAVMLRHVRACLLAAPHVELHRLCRLDERAEAHLDGVAVGGAQGLSVLDAILETPSVGTMFVVTVVALRSRHERMLTRLVAIATALPEVQRGFTSALGWVSAEDLQGTVRALLGSNTPSHRAWGLAACSMHRFDPGPLLAQATRDANPVLRMRAWRVVGQSGRRDLADAARQAVAQPELAPTPTLALADPQAERRAAAWALSLLGEGQEERVREALLAPEPGKALPCLDAHRLATIAAPLGWGRDQVRALALQAESSPPHKRRMMRLAGWVGDVQVIPWLIHHMADDIWARLAGEAFSLITGADLALLDIERKPPEGVDFGPNADPEDEDVAMDEDDSLPWPDQAKVQTWWQTNARRFTPDQRYFAGELPSPTHCIHVLQTKGQRQRIQAAEYLCLLRPGSKLFPVAAPAWRQQRWLVEEAKALGLPSNAA
jgi:uncharacterized protein (TIGR02270 family)